MKKINYSFFSVLYPNYLIFDYEEKNTYSIRVRTTDRDGGIYEKQLTISINNLTEAPVLSDEIGTPMLTEIEKDSEPSQGDIVADILKNGDVTSAQGKALEGIGITGADNTNGTWEYSVDNGDTWACVADTGGRYVDMSAESLLLSSSDRIRFVPDTGYAGTASFEFRPWNMSSGTAGETADTRSNGGVTPFGTETVRALLRILQEEEPGETYICGRVTAEDTGKGLAHYRAEVWSGDMMAGEAVTDMSGYYSVTIPSASDYVVSVWPVSEPGEYYHQFYNGKNRQSEATRVSVGESGLNSIDFVLKKASGCGIRGRVHDGRHGIAGIQVNVFSESIMSGMSTFTDEDGFYAFTDLRFAADYRVSVWSDEFGTDVYYALPEGQRAGYDIPAYSVLLMNQATLVLPAANQRQYIDIILNFSKNTYDFFSPAEDGPEEDPGREPSAVTGYVVDSDGIPFRDVLVSIHSECANTEDAVKTDENGYYVFEGLDTCGEINDYVITVYAEDCPPQCKGQKRAGDQVNFIFEKDKSDIVSTMGDYTLGMIPEDGTVTVRTDEIIGRVTDYRLEPIPEGVVVIVKVFKENSGFLKRVRADNSHRCKVKDT
ncbi:carboxypeptidase-like regulatory domain-containing protein [Desulfonema magnum]|uniref:Carboxypeptidase regulatory-like domain-containing protein n=1 Tax=Desulfonema magnum TaxID=45655 RepID=A0A975BKS9_9BACT|nr:carboxypeptidase-like regulatory domain-containing protein [Desulfonema magnum]QTA86889.1 Carboxypeptidase regulatory-like domain-containing protein [Desulfonema magnum]